MSVLDSPLPAVPALGPEGGEGSAESLAALLRTAGEDLLSGRAEDALANYERVLEEAPALSDALVGRAAALRSLGRPREALMSLLQLLGRAPDDKAARVEMALALRDLGRAEDARAVYSILCRETDAAAGAWHGLAELLLAEHRDASARICLGRALRIDPAHVPARLALAGLEGRSGDYAAAADLYLDVLAVAPENAPAHAGLGRALMSMGRLDEADDAFERALACDEDCVAAHLGRAHLRLLSGDIPGHWEDFEWRWQQPGARFPDMPGDAWDGGPLDGRTLLLFAERGIGETVRMLRYVPRALAMGGKVVLAVPAPLAPLAEGMAGVEAVLSSGQVLPPGIGIDLHASLAELPRLFGTTLADVPADIPYLEVPQGRRPPILAPAGARFRVGLSWSGLLPADRLKSIPFPAVMPLLAVPGCVFFGLQLPPGNEDIDRFAHPALITDLSATVSDFADLAGRIAELDLIITTDGPTADIAGALGKPVWVMLPAAPEARWMLGREDSPWYPGMRLFRQERAGDWSGVVARVAIALEAAIAEADERRMAALKSVQGTGAAVRAMLAGHLAGGDLLLDVGPGDGSVALDAAQHPSGDVRVLAVEADPRQAEMLVDTIAICGGEEAIEVVAAAAGESGGSAVVSRRPRGGRKVFVLPDWVPGPVPVTALDSLLADRPELGDRRIVVRLGTDGSEALALGGLWEPLMTQRAAVFVFEHREGGRAAEILGESGYSLHCFPGELAIGPLEPFDGRPGAVLALASGIEPLASYGEKPADAAALPEELDLARIEAEAFFRQSQEALQAGRFGEAAHLLGRALGKDPAHARANGNLGFLARRMRRPDAAALCYRRALAVTSGAALWSNLGNVLREMGRLDEAEAALLKAVAANPADSACLYNLALVERERGRPREYLALIERCRSLAPEKAPEWERAEALLKAGDFARGLPALAHRRKPELPAPLPGQPWDGSPLDARSILVHDELDSADTLLLARFLPRIGRHGGLVTLACQPEIAGLMATLPGVEAVVPWGGVVPECDARVSLLDVPGLLGADGRTLPREVPYIHLPEGRKPFAFPADGRLRIGIVWSGRPGARHVPPACLLNLAAAHEGVHLISLQRGEAAGVLSETGARAYVEDMGAQFETLDDCASVIAGLDLVVAADGPELHLAAAMGRPAWAVLPLGSGWRWVDGRDDSPWYPTLRVFRQTQDGGWDRAIARMSELAAAMAAGKRRRG